MPQRDLIHDAVRQALEKDGWSITADPFTFNYKRIQVHADLEAERVVEAEQDGRRIIGEQPMDRTEEYRTLVKRLLSEMRTFILQHSREERELWCAFDDTRGQYLLLNTGWQNGVRHNGATLYIRVQNSKIYVEEDWLEDGIVGDLLANGVSKEDVVLAWQSPDMRPFTEFAVA